MILTNKIKITFFSSSQLVLVIQVERSILIFTLNSIITWLKCIKVRFGWLNIVYGSILMAWTNILSMLMHWIGLNSWLFEILSILIGENGMSWLIFLRTLQTLYIRWIFYIFFFYLIAFNLFWYHLFILYHFYLLLTRFFNFYESSLVDLFVWNNWLDYCFFFLILYVGRVALRYGNSIWCIVLREYRRNNLLLIRIWF